MQHIYLIYAICPMHLPPHLINPPSNFVCCSVFRRSYFAAVDTSGNMTVDKGEFEKIVQVIRSTSGGIDESERQMLERLRAAQGSEKKLPPLDEVAEPIFWNHAHWNNAATRLDNAMGAEKHAER